MQAFYRMHNVKRLPTRPQIPWPNRAEMGGTIVQDVSLGTRGYRLQKPGPDHTGTNSSCPVDGQGSNGEKYIGDHKCKTPMELAMGRRPRDLLDPASTNPEQLTSTPTKQDLLNEEIQKLVMKTHLEVQQREDIRRDPAERIEVCSS